MLAYQRMISLPPKVSGGPRSRPLSGRRIILALAVAVAADGLQLSLTAAGWVGPDQIIDLLAMLVLIPLIGFHWLLLPSFILELVPVLDDLPTWTGCVLAVVAIRKHQCKTAAPVAPPVVQRSI
jgi:hypothetical protein